MKTSTTKKRRAARPRRLFVLDTNVLMHDPAAIFRFEEHDIYLPMVVLEELDAAKKGMSEASRNTRQVSRFLDELMRDATREQIEAGLPLPSNLSGNHGKAPSSGRVFFQTQHLAGALPDTLPGGGNDNAILAQTLALQALHTDRQVVLVSKDINLRIKAAVVGVHAEDYFSDRSIEDADVLYTGTKALAEDFWERHGKDMRSWKEGPRTFYELTGPAVTSWTVNEFVYEPRTGGLEAIVRKLQGNTATLELVRDFRGERHGVWGIGARNREQNFALNLLMDPEIDIVTLTGTAGTGKTLMALASGLTQVLDDRRYTEIIVTRATVSVGEDIGFLPGTEEEKMGPWMGALDDNLEVLGKTETSAGEWGRAATNELIRSKIKIKSMNFMRGRTFLNKYVIIDEAQNLTPKQMKTLITRAGPGTKIICMGNLAQIDTPYLTEGSSGLTFAVDRFKGWPHGGHITLARGERSRLADFASDAL